MTVALSSMQCFDEVAGNKRTFFASPGNYICRPEVHDLGPGYAELTATFPTVPPTLHALTTAPTPTSCTLCLRLTLHTPRLLSAGYSCIAHLGPLPPADVTVISMTPPFVTAKGAVFTATIEAPTPLFQRTGTRILLRDKDATVAVGVAI
eukprot:TRINITY_DN26451_c0_g1_i1.p1 TRINITY_DN26451_c0_g1~~TRINITY_DN26451_c0_g1_i1.p1  ORF type:complete len:166 (+),score=24.14 TRINITY_DN26451_c0_g1_i1:49-498(+)